MSGGGGRGMRVIRTADELKKAGIDMTSPQPVKDALMHFDKLVNDFKDVYSKL